MTKYTVKVSFLSNDTHSDYLCEFIVEALESWAGQLRPDDPLFGGLENVSAVIESQQATSGGATTARISDQPANKEEP
jgi:hypothetical protein